jgi:hypothetical protein
LTKPSEKVSNLPNITSLPKINQRDNSDTEGVSYLSGKMTEGKNEEYQFKEAMSIFSLNEDVKKRLDVDIKQLIRQSRKKNGVKFIRAG